MTELPRLAIQQKLIEAIALIEAQQHYEATQAIREALRLLDDWPTNASDTPPTGEETVTRT